MFIASLKVGTGTDLHGIAHRMCFFPFGYLAGELFSRWMGSDEKIRQLPILAVEECSPYLDLLHFLDTDSQSSCKSC